MQSQSSISSGGCNLAVNMCLCSAETSMTAHQDTMCWMACIAIGLSRCVPVASCCAQRIVCVVATAVFVRRSQHKAFAYTYIAKWARQEQQEQQARISRATASATATATAAAAGPGATGTGTPHGSSTSQDTTLPDPATTASKISKPGMVQGAAGVSDQAAPKPGREPLEASDTGAEGPQAEAALKGTGGSDFMPALQGYQDTTSRHLLPP